MTGGHSSPLARFLQRMRNLPRGGLSDAELVKRYVEKRDEAAFELLLWRHGPKVWGVCRRLLHNEQDAEDAFQAAFLVLARKAGSISNRQAVASWLYRVAYRAALQAKDLAKRRVATQPCSGELPEPARIAGSEWSDLRMVLDEEVNRLPEKYRLPFILCYLDGKSNAEAAQQIGCPKGTVQSRLAWARERLRARLTRRGLALSVGILASGELPAPVKAAVPARLLKVTLETTRLANTGAVGGVVSSQAITFAHGVVQAMFWTKIKIVTVCVLAVSGLGIAGGVCWREMPGAGVMAGPPSSEPPARTDKPAGNAAAPRPKEKLYAFEMRDKPWAQVLEWLSDQTGLPVIGAQKLKGTLNFISPRARDGQPRKYTIPEIIDILNEGLLAGPNDEQYVLIRRQRSFILHPASAAVPAAMVELVPVKDLDKHGQTEIVSIILPLKALVAMDVGPEIKKMLGPFGKVVASPAPNQLYLLDMASNLRRIHQMVQDIEKGAAKKK